MNRNIWVASYEINSLRIALGFYYPQKAAGIMKFYWSSFCNYAIITANFF